MEDSVLVSFAILNTNWEQRRKSFVDNFVPFVADCLRTNTRREVSATDMQECLRERFGLDLPIAAIDTVLHRSRRENVVHEEAGVLVRNDEVVQRYDLTRVRAETLRQYEALLQGLRDYALEQHSSTWTPEEADLVLRSYLERRALPVLRQMLRGGAPRGLLEGSEADFVVASFMTWVCESNPALFEFLDTAAKGSMLATALYLPHPGDMGGRFRDLRVVLDTPFLLRALGYQGESQEAAAIELVGMLRRLGARLCCLPATLREMRGVLDACSRLLTAPRGIRVSMPIVDYCLTRGLTPADVDVLRERLESDLERLGIAIVDPPEVTAKLSVDEDQLEKVLQDRVGYRRKEARIHDVNALTAVFRFRDGKEQRQLEDARAIFVTTNGRLVGASQSFFQEEPRGDQVNVAVLDHELGTVVWLKSPLRAPDFPAKLVLADAYAALNPPDAMWDSYLDTIDRLSESKTITDEDYVILRYSVEARRALMYETRGDIRAFTTGTIHDVLEAAKRHLSDESRRELAAVKGERDVERAQRRGAERRQKRALVELEKQRAAQDASQQRHVSKIEGQAHRVASVASRIVFWVLVVASVVAGVVSLSGAAETWPAGLRLGVHVVAIGGIVIGIAGAIAGESASSISGRVRGWLTTRLSRLFTRWFGPDD